MFREYVIMTLISSVSLVSCCNCILSCSRINKNKHTKPMQSLSIYALEPLMLQFLKWNTDVMTKDRFR